MSEIQQNSRPLPTSNWQITEKAQMLNGRFFFDVMKWVDNRKVVTKSFLKKPETKAKAVSSVFSEDQTLGDGVPHLSEMSLLRKSIFGLFRPKLNSSEYNDEFHDQCK